MKKFISALIILTMIITCLNGCGIALGESKDSDKISVVTTIFPLYDFARAVSGGKADITMLIKPGAEAHSYEPSQPDIIKIRNADLFIYIGGESDKWVDTLLKSTDGVKVKTIKLIDYVKAVKEEIVEGMEGGSDEEEYDEHIWTSQKNAVLMIEMITAALCEVDEFNSEEYRNNAGKYIAEIQNVSAEITEIVENTPNKLLVFGDRFPFRYFADEYGLDYRAAFPGCSSQSEVSAATLAYLINTVKDKNIPFIFHIEQSNKNIARTICEETGAEMLLLHSCQTVTADEFKAGVTYLSLIKQNAENLKKGLYGY